MKKTFENLTFNDAIYSVTENGIAEKHIIYDEQGGVFGSHCVAFTFEDNVKSPMFEGDRTSQSDSESTMWFADVEDAKSYVEGILKAAHAIVHNCLESKFEIFIE